MLDRLCGLETEYAVRFSPRDHKGPQPATAELWLPLVASLSDLVATGRRGGLFFHEVFTENGGAVSVESKNIVEGKTPECRGPSEVLLYQRAQECLLAEALPGLQDRLAVRGFPGELSLIKNCRDADGNVYGAQENYELEVASGAGLVAYRAGVLMAIVLAIPSVIATWILVVGFGLSLLAVAIVLGLLSIVSSQARRVFSQIDRWMNHLDRSQGAGKAFEISQIALWAPSFFSLILLTRLFAFRRIRRDLAAFFLSRPILSGTGTLEEDGSFQLSEKAPAMRSLVRVWPTSGRCVFDNGNLLKRLQGLFILDWRSTAGLWNRRQRLQVGLADSNRAQVAEYLRLATTLLAIDAAEAGMLDDSPRLKRPIRSLHRIAADSGLGVEVPVSGRSAMTALEIQRYYLDRVKEYVSRSPAAPVEAWSIVRLWERVLGALATDPKTLVGELDWITKRFLLETAGSDLSQAARKKIDIRYHELATGYFDRYEVGGHAPTLLDPAEIVRAMREPPQGSPAKIRGSLVRRLKEAGDSGRSRISWDSVRVRLRRRGFRVLVSLDSGGDPTTQARHLALVRDAAPIPIHEPEPEPDPEPEPERSPPDGGTPQLSLVPTQAPHPSDVGVDSLRAPPDGAQRRPCPDDMCTGTLNELGLCNYCGLRGSR